MVVNTYFCIREIYGRFERFEEPAAQTRVPLARFTRREDLVSKLLEQKSLVAQTARLFDLRFTIHDLLTPIGGIKKNAEKELAVAE